MKRSFFILMMFAFVFSQAQKKKPNILVIWGDDIGWANISKYNHGMMGYQTPNIDRIANEGAMFTDWYAQQSCTAGRAAFISVNILSEQVCLPLVCQEQTRYSRRYAYHC
jgi:hypothetical protein